MLKRFLKFFKTEDQEVPDFEGSYLDFVLAQIEPNVRNELATCSGHDPLLLVIAELLRHSMRGVWSEAIERPLTDEHSPGASKPAASAPPPPPPGSSMREDTSEAEETTLDDLPLPDFQEEEVLDEDSELIEEVSEIEEVDETAEFDRSHATGALREPLPRVDQKEVLQAGRVFLGMLIENDRLPFDLQLGLEETMLARDLLVGYFVGNQDFEDRAQQLLRIVERKFGDGLYSQARILLQLFQTDRSTRIRNDRNIFYEDMIQRLGIRRRHPIAADLKTELEAEATDELGALARWLEQNLFIKLHLFTRHPQQVRAWQEVGELSTLEGATDSLMRFLPPRRWRPFVSSVEESELPGADVLKELVREHISAETLSSYVTGQLRTCYFVLRAVGDTGLEGYLDTFFDWTRQALSVDTTQYLPELYRRSMSESDTMRSIFLDVYRRGMKEASEERLHALSDEEIIQATRDAVAFVRGCDFDEVAPGNYDFGGFIYDQLFGVEYPSAEFAFKLHRLT